MAEARIGLIGLGVMGANLALNIAEKGYPVAVHNRTTSAIDDFIGGAGKLADRLVAAETPEALVAALTPPRAIIIMVKAGAPVDATIDALTPHLDKGDIIIDAGNADFNDTRRREAALRRRRASASSAWACRAAKRARGMDRRSWSAARQRPMARSRRSSRPSRRNTRARPVPRIWGPTGPGISSRRCTTASNMPTCR